ncbi:MAG: hypothetical protein HRT66_08335 [Flavobacteriaceae bacterium]|nr:hypothetical protein [Flavobacteriaceae bacterium]
MNKSLLYILRISSLIILSLILTNCKSKKKETSSARYFKDHIVSFSSGELSSSAEIIIKLKNSVDFRSIDKDIVDDVLEFSPSVKGTAYWINNKTIGFIPTNKMKQGQQYSVVFSYGKLAKVNNSLSEFNFDFSIIKQSMSIEFKALDVVNKNDGLYNLRGTVELADKVKLNDLKKCLSARYNNIMLYISWEENNDSNKYKFTVEGVKRTYIQNKVILKWDGEGIDYDKQGSVEYIVPMKGVFKILNIEKLNDNKKGFEIEFSDELKRRQDLRGLIYTEPKLKLNLVVNSNKVLVYVKDTYATGEYTLYIDRGVKNYENKTLGGKHVKNILLENLKPKIELLSDGNILPNSGSKLLFPFKSVNLSAVDVKIIKVYEDNILQFLQVNNIYSSNQLKRVGKIVYRGRVALESDKDIDYGRWNNFSIDLTKLINQELGAIYRVSLSFIKDYSLYECNTVNTNQSSTQYTNYSPEEQWYDNMEEGWYYYGNNYYSSYRASKNPCDDSYYKNKDNIKAKNVLASNFGIIVKENNKDELRVVVSDLRTTNPIEGATVELYNIQQKVMTTATTDKDGIANIKYNKKYFALIVRKGKERGYIKLNDGRVLSLSMFDVSGGKASKGIKGYMYGDRGVWRPGDSIYLNFALQDKDNVFPDELPIKFKLYDPHHSLVVNKSITDNTGGIYDLRTKTSEDSPTGNWTAEVEVGANKFSRTIKIETIKPNKLKMKLKFVTKMLSTNTTTGSLQVNWLHGSPGKNLKTDIELNLKETKTKFDSYTNFNFDDPQKSFEKVTKMIFDSKVDAQGKATVRPNIKTGRNSPGMLMASFKIRSFEKGGDFSVDRSTILYSPYDSYVGLNMPKGDTWNGALISNNDNSIPIVTLGDNGKPIDIANLKVEVYELNWRWWWDMDEKSNYLSAQEMSLVKTGTVSTKNGRAFYNFNLNKNHYGRLYIKVYNPKSKHSTGAVFYTTYDSWSASDNVKSKGSEMLSFNTDKDNYSIGQSIKVTIPNAKQGKVWVSIEKGSKIIDNYWIDVSEEVNNFSIVTTEAMTPNVYINLSLIQPHKNTLNDLPIRMYGVKSIGVVDDNTKLKPIISMPQELAPNKKFTIKVSEKNSKEMSYTIAIVDEGLLDITGFKTPNLWNHFYSKEALSIKTWDMYSYVIGSFAGSINSLSEVGGDEYNKNKGESEANRFKPVVKFIGPIKLDKGSTNSHTIMMPNYVGSVKTMIIAKSGSAYGKQDISTPVKQPLMVLATLPRVLSPGEEVSMPVTIFCMDNKIKNVKLSFKSNDMFSIVKDKTKHIVFDETGDKVVFYKLKVKEKIGIAKVSVEVSSGKHKAKHNIELQIRLPNTSMTKVSDGLLEDGEKWSTTYSPVGMIGTNSNVLEVSSIPPIKLEDRLDYLIRYPHGCVEQTTSSVFPQLFLSNLLVLDANKKKEIESNIKKGILRIKKFQQFNGGLSYWIGSNDYVSDWGTNYAGHFMIEAKNKGYSLPDGFLSSWIRYQTKKSNSWTVSDYKYRRSSSELDQAYRLYTLALVGKPVLGAMNRLYSDKNISLKAKWRLAAAYKLAGKPDIAYKLVKDISLVVPSSKYYGNYGSNERKMAMLLETLTILDQKDRAKDILMNISDKLSSNSWMSTQTTAYCLLAISKYCGGKELVKSPIKYKLKTDNINKTMTTEALIDRVGLKGEGDNNIEVVNNSGQVLFVKMQSKGTPMSPIVENSENDIRMSIVYKDMLGKKIDISTMDLGTDFIMEVKFRHPGTRADYKDIAWTQLIPSGWELRNLRLDGVDLGSSADTPRYQDIRDDRVHTYFDLDKGKAKVFRLLFNAAYLGTFKLPSSYCEAMYDNSISAVKKGGEVKVVVQGGGI